MVGVLGSRESNKSDMSALPRGIRILNKPVVRLVRSEKRRGSVEKVGDYDLICNDLYFIAIQVSSFFVHISLILSALFSSIQHVTTNKIFKTTNF